MIGADAAATIRLARPGDVAAIQDLNAALFAYEAPLDGHSRNLDWPYTSFARAYFGRACAGQDGNQAWVAQAGEQTVGYLCASVRPILYMAHNPVAEIENMFVVEAFRGRGVGSALVAAFKDWAHEHGARRLKVGALTTNHPALNFYRRHGFGDIITELEQSVE